MSITAQPTFQPTKYAKGAGCLKCGSNVSEVGSKVNTQCVDLGVEDEFLGRFALCYDCAIQVALAIGFVSKFDVAEILNDAKAVFKEAADLEESAAAEAAQARLDRDVVERLLGSVYTEEPVAS